MRKLVTILFTVLAVSAGARQISPEEAAAVASAFFNPASRSSEKVAVSRAQNNATATNATQPYYVFNSEDDRGFVIVSGDDRTRPILGYSDSGIFDFNNLPPQLEWLLGEYANEIETLASSPDTSAYTTTADDTRAPIEPLIKTHWGQGEPFNNSCPLISGERAAAGCVATALAQVMNYHRWPEHGQGTHSYESNGETYSIDFSQIEFDWDAMLDDYDSNSSERSKDAVATLMKACGYGVNMKYGIDESIAESFYIKDATTTFFDYSSRISYIIRTDYTSEQWEDAIYNQLSKGLPVIYGAINENLGGHCFVCDGYDSNGYFHFNWGWSGRSDGYFLISGHDADIHGFNLDQYCFINLFPSNKALDYCLSDGAFIYTEIGANELALIGIANPDSKISGDVILPDKIVIDGIAYDVTKMTCELSEILDKDNLTSLDIRTPITAISYFEFKDLTNLKHIKFPSTLLSIGYSAFYGCSGLTDSLDIPDSVESIGSWAFYGCSGLTGSLNIPNSVKSIGDMAFNGCSGLDGELTLPNAITSIPDGVFGGCSGLSGQLTIPNTVTYIGSAAFFNCSGLSGELILPNSITDIGYSAFDGCSGFSGVLTLPNTITSIASWTFHGCSGLSGELTIPNSVTSIEIGAFYGCSGFSGELNLPPSLNSIGHSAFYGCSGFIGSLTIPHSLSSIEERTFYACSSLTGSLLIPNSIKYIGDLAFSNCSFTTISCSSQTPPSIETTSFSGYTYDSVGLNVPEDALESYRNHAVWSLFKSLSYIYPTQIVLDLTELEGTEGDQIQLSVTVSPDDATDKTVTWSTSNASVAEVDANGLVTAIAPGTAKITATTTNGIEAICTVTVYAKSGLIDIISGDDVSVTTCDGEIIVKAHDGTQVEVFTPAGVLVARTTEHRITGLSTGIYIVHVCGKVVKVRI